MALLWSDKREKTWQWSMRQNIFPDLRRSQVMEQGLHQNSIFSKGLSEFCRQDDDDVSPVPEEPEFRDNISCLAAKPPSEKNKTKFIGSSVNHVHNGITMSVLVYLTKRKNTFVICDMYK